MRADDWTGTLRGTADAQKPVIRFITFPILYREPGKVGDVDQICGQDE